MSTRTIEELFDDETIPLCFDTNSIYGKKEGPLLLMKTRERFQSRKLLIPALVVAERSRQLKAEMGDKFKRSSVKSFLSDEDLKLEVASFDEKVALGGWLNVVGRFTNLEWDWKRQPPEKPRPCAERCRTGDHIVYALALTHGALLVTGDGGLLKQVAADGTYPGAIHTNQFKALLESPAAGPN
ncbi:MAG: hypothetical protein RKP73_17135 [Candidatus Contendobacter sp.]|nr:hypothetical protein [Candidatus Contendobacter sp.]